MQFVFMIPHIIAYKLIIHDKKRANSLKTVIMNDSDSNTTTLLK